MTKSNIVFYADNCNQDTLMIIYSGCSSSLVEKRILYNYLKNNNNDIKKEENVNVDVCLNKENIITLVKRK